MLDIAYDVEDAIGEIQAQLGIAMPTYFWERTVTQTLGEVVDALLAAGALPGEKCAPHARG